ncbi:MAG: 2-oxoacid:ferredoxin oxidoreductase subunit beta [Chloroflexi bacterium]|nr:2-oxoacid:ferredoxin oxidoreductase subunit beta [Chloroflexota bacterium]
MTAVAPGDRPALSRKDFVTDQDVRWCPGCGDYSILAQTQKLMPELGIPRENIVFISGIGCSSRLPYYMNTYGFHSIHGRAPAIASGLKVTRPDLQVWVVTGDGDGLSIGGNHLLHIIRRNMDVVIVLFNNRIYGLTKGQYSPTSEQGKITKTSPYGTIDYPVNALSFAIGAGASFIARSLDIDTHHLVATLERAAHHTGTSFVEVFQNCNVYNDGAFMEFADKSVRPDRTVILEQGKPLIFGKERNRGLRLNGVTPEIVELGNSVTEADLLVHDETREDPTIASILARMAWPQFPVPLGVLQAVERPTYDELLDKQIEDAIAREGEGDLAALLAEGDTWVVE